MEIGPLTVIKPIPEGVKPMLNQIFCCAKIEPRIDYMSLLALNASFVYLHSRQSIQTFMDDTLEPWKDYLLANGPPQ